MSKHAFAVLYHRGCNDGLASAWAAKGFLSDRAVYMAYQYGDKIPEAVNGKHLILVDLSLPSERMQELLASRVRSIMVIDHHASVEDDLAQFDTVTTVEDYMARIREPVILKYFDKDHCGAILTWRFFSGLTEITEADYPVALKYIDDYDRWIKKLPNTDVINAWLINGKPDPDRISQIMTPDGKGLNPKVLEIGQALVNYDLRVAKSVVRDYPIIREHKGVRVAWINAPHHLRNIISDLMIQSKEVDIVVCYSIRREKVIYSLRSNDQCDVSIIAAQLGGGGHPNSAAFGIAREIDHVYPHFNLMGNLGWRMRLRFMWSAFWNRQK